MEFKFKSLADIDDAFRSEQDCCDHLASIRWPTGITCPRCGVVGGRVYDLRMGRYKCGERTCASKFTVRHDTIFGDSKLPLRTWFKAVFLMTSNPKGVSSYQLARTLGMCQKTAWFMLHRIREASKTREFQAPLTGTVEADEAYVGGQGRWKHKSKKEIGGSGPNQLGKGRGQYRGVKHMVLGMMQREGELRFVHLREQRAFPILKATLHANILRGARVHTDEAAHYHWMGGDYAHEVVVHSLGEYARGDVTTNRIEGAFGHFKRSIHGIYHKVSDEHLDRYLQSFTWRWNRRWMNESERMNDLLRMTPGKRIRYKTLTDHSGVQHG